MSLEDNFDENQANAQMDLYSRQLATFGVETMKNLTKLRVLIVGVRGVGIETAKNIVLAGPAAVTIYDNEPVVIADLGTNFFLNEDSVGQPRAAAVLDELAQLNEFVDVTAYDGEVDGEYLAGYGVVIVTNDTPFATLVEWDEYCRNNNILFLLAKTNGVVATIFTDFGDVHTVTDSNGEPPRVNVIDDINLKEDDDGAYLEIVISANRHGLDDGQLVTFDDVKGTVELNELGEYPISRLYRKIPQEDGKFREVLLTNKFGIRHEAVAGWGEYLSGGLVTEVKPSRDLNFKSLANSVTHPYTTTNWLGILTHPNEEKLYMGFAEQLHFLQLALWEFQGRNERLPEIHNEDDANQVVELAKEVSEKHKGIEDAVTVEVNEDFVRTAALYVPTELPGMTAFLGGVIAQEVVKKFGKYTPVHQWIHVDFSELLSEAVPVDAQPVGSRYDHQVAIFGAEFQRKIEAQRYFMVGCGALGCEYLKGFALMGLGAGEGGVLHVTDMDRIEVSNLNRQFLFRRENVHQQKSVCAANRARVMNPNMNIESYETPVGNSTENFFNDPFWENLTGVCNALDNVKAREYVDSKCVFYGLSLLESGTLGTKANSEIIIPYQTKSYREHEKDDEDEDTIPMCTLRNFPHLIDHCIEWARSQFTDVFEDPPKNANKYINDKETFFRQLKRQQIVTKIDTLKSVQKHLDLAGRPTFQTALQIAAAEFASQYRDRILNLVTAFPEDSMKKDSLTGEESPFWAGSKRFPQAAELDLDDELHFDYIYTASNLYAFMLGVDYVRDRDELKALALETDLSVPDWQPSKAFMAKIQAEVEAEDNEGQETVVVEESSTEVLAGLTEELEAFDASGCVELTAADFEKDDDENFHIDFITACSNMRAWNYHIPAASRHKCKMIAGKIMPAVATTTAMICGLVELELYKLLLGLDKAKFLCANVNLGVGTMRLFEPVAPEGAKKEFNVITLSEAVPVPDGFTSWDKVVVDRGDLTVSELVDSFPEAHHGCQIEAVYFAETQEDEDGNAIATPVWFKFPITEGQRTASAANADRKVSEIYMEQFGEPPAGRNYILLSPAVLTAEDDDAVIPPVKFVFRE